MKKANGEYDLPEQIADFLVDLARPTESCPIGLVGPFAPAMRAAVGRYAARYGLDLLCQEMQIQEILRQADEYRRAPLLSTPPDQIDLVLLTPPFVHTRDLPGLLQEQMHAAVLLGYVPSELVFLLAIASVLAVDGSALVLLSEGALRQAGRFEIRERLLTEYEIDFIAALPSEPAWDLRVRTGVLKVTRRGHRPERAWLFSTVRAWADCPAVASLLHTCEDIAARTSLQVEMVRAGSSALFSLSAEETLLYETLLPAQLYYARFIQTQFSRYDAVKLGEIAEFRTGLPPRRFNRESEVGPDRLISGRCITPEGDIQNARRVSVDVPDPDNRERLLTQEGDILIGRVLRPFASEETSMLRLALVTPEWSGCYFDSSVMRLRIHSTDWRFTPEYIYRILKMDYELRPEFGELVGLQLRALTSGPMTTHAALQQLDIPALPESIRQLFDRDLDLSKLNRELNRLQQRISRLTESLNRLKVQAMVEGDDVESVLARLEEWIVGSMERDSELDIERHQDRLRSQVVAWDHLEEQSRRSLATAEWIIANSDPELDFSFATLSHWKCVETELLAKIFEPFRRWIWDQWSDLDTFLYPDTHGPVSEDTKDLVGFVRCKKLSIGQMRWESALVSGKRTIKASPLLQAFRDYLERHCADPSFFLSKDQGIQSLLTEENIQRYRNDAAHTGVLDKSLADESHKIVIGGLDRILQAIGRVDHSQHGEQESLQSKGA